MPHISWFTRMPTRANPADSPSRGEAAHLNGDQRLLETTVCECARLHKSFDVGHA